MRRCAVDFLLGRITSMAHIEATKFKLAEAEFFYEKIAELGRRAAVYEPAAFRFYFSAFLSAARSVTFVLQSEAKDQYDAWFPSWLNARASDQAALLVSFNSERVAAIHQRGVRIQQGTEPVPFREWLAAAAREGVQVFGNFGATQPDMEGMTWFFRFDGAEVEAVQAARNYLDILQKLVNDFESAHAAP